MLSLLILTPNRNQDICQLPLLVIKFMFLDNISDNILDNISDNILDNISDNILDSCPTVQQ